MASVLALSGSACTGQWPFTAALGLERRVTVQRPAAGERTDLAVLVDRLLRRSGVSLEDIDELRLDIGPGSYVGLRVAVTFARVLAGLQGTRLSTTTSFALMAAAMPPVADRVLRPVLDARRGRLHSQPLRLHRGQLQELSPPAALPPAELLALITPGELLVCAQALHATLQPARERGAELAEPAPVDAGVLFSAALPLQPADPRTIEPLYLMGSYADG